MSGDEVACQEHAFRPNAPIAAAEDPSCGGIRLPALLHTRLSSYRSPDHEALVERARFHLRNAVAETVTTTEGDLQAYVFEPEGGAPQASVLMVHGWTGEASFMTAFAEHFRKRGMRAVLFDLPAHGRSAGERTSSSPVPRRAQVAEALGPIQHVVAHRWAGSRALVASGGRAPMPRAYPPGLRARRHAQQVLGGDTQVR